MTSAMRMNHTSLLPAGVAAPARRSVSAASSGFRELMVSGRPGTSRPAPTKTPPAAAPAKATAAAAYSWEPDPQSVSPYGLVTHYNPAEFATAATAQAVAQKLGGTVQDTVLSGFSQSAPQRLIVVPGKPPLNAGLVASLFAKYGDQSGSQAWQLIDRDLRIG